MAAARPSSLLFALASSPAHVSVLGMHLMGEERAHRFPKVNTPPRLRRLPMLLARITRIDWRSIGTGSRRRELGVSRLGNL